MSVVEEAFVVPFYILATTSMGTILEDVILMDVIDGLKNITAKRCCNPWAYTSEHVLRFFAKPN